MASNQQYWVLDAGRLPTDSSDRTYFALADPDGLSGRPSLLYHGSDATPGQGNSTGITVDLGAFQVHSGDHAYGLTHFQTTADLFTVMLPAAEIVSDRYALWTHGATVSASTRSGTPQMITTWSSYAYLGAGRSASDGGPGPLEFWNGHLAEVMVYNRSLSDSERARVESYLAIKYGLTLGRGRARVDYQSSAGDVVWDAGVNGSYAEDVTAIAFDSAFGLSQLRSRSSNWGSVLTLSSTGDMLDGSYLVVSSDAGSLNETSNGIPTGVVQRLTRVWRISSTGAVGSVSLSFDLNGRSASGNARSDFKLMLDVDSDFTTGAILIPATDYSNDVVIFADVQLQDASFVTLATK